MAEGTISGQRKSKEKKKRAGNQQMMLIIGVVVAAVIAVGAVVFISTSGINSGSSIDYSAIPQERLEDGGFVLGNPDARVTVVAFEDFLCPHCQTYTRTVVDPFIEEYVATGQARFEFRMLPAVHPTFSEIAARFVECADTVEPGSFWRAHDVMFALTSAQPFGDQSPRTFAERMDMSYSDLLACTAEADQVGTDAQLGSRNDVSATPTVMIRIDGGELQPASSQQPTLEALSNLIASYQ